MPNVKISALPEFTGDTTGTFLPMINSAQNATSKVSRDRVNVFTYTLQLGYSGATSLAQNTTYLTGYSYGSPPLTLIDDRPSRRAIIPRTGIIKNITVMTAMGGSGSASMQIQLRNITTSTTNTIDASYGMSSISLSGLSRIDFYDGLSIPVTKNDVMQWRNVTPATWTAPTNVSQLVTLYIESI